MPVGDQDCNPLLASITPSSIRDVGSNQDFLIYLDLQHLHFIWFVSGWFKTKDCTWEAIRNWTPRRLSMFVYSTTTHPALDRNWISWSVKRFGGSLKVAWMKTASNRSSFINSSTMISFSGPSPWTFWDRMWSRDGFLTILLIIE